ncbi:MULTISPECIES: lysophospholipid acyltransferase family protein [Marinovum]|uniref:lysophospholipid acyltransferase family protein n=1 Tax=Marinovum TaxID=367771 RepID=UPI00237C3731|nr:MULTISPECIES: lysophospholipid acyltransferase family protein [Marinovum]MDD9744628.1 lysophospholipid acyltransferase family protein [Marinovum sp. PR37]
MQYARSLLFNFQMYLMLGLMGIAYFPLALASRDGAQWACKTYCRWVRWTAGWMVGLKTEVRGAVPQGEVLVAAKHQSFLDIIIIFSALPAAKFIMKRELLWAPVLGQYAARIGCVPVARGKRGAAIKKMVADVAAGMANPGQLVIYPQGTRVAPNRYLPYKVGSHVLYAELGQPCVPAATNVGVFWPRHGVLRKPGLAVVEFLEPIAPGQSRASFLNTLEEVVERRSQELMLEAGFADLPEENRHLTRP